MAKMQERYEYDIGGYHYYIAPFNAIKSARMSGEVLGLVTPMISALLPLVNMGDAGKSASEAIMDMDMADLGDTLGKAFAGLDGATCERLLSELLFEGNIGVVWENGKTVRLEGEVDGVRVADEVFCCAGENMYILAWDVIMVNWGGFLKRLMPRSGSSTTDTPATN